LVVIGGGWEGGKAERRGEEEMRSRRRADRRDSDGLGGDWCEGSV
jgi:hypothetical protein